MTAEELRDLAMRLRGIAHTITQEAGALEKSSGVTILYQWKPEGIPIGVSDAEEPKP